MSYEISYERKTSNHKQEKNIVVNNADLYKVYLEKEIVNTDVVYVLKVRCDNNNQEIEIILPHEVLSELEKMIADSLSR